MLELARGWSLTACAAMVVLVLDGCTRSEGSGDADPPASTSHLPVVHAVNYPLAYFAERIGDGRVDVRFLAPPDEDPAFWSPNDSEIAAMQAASLILLNGADYAKWRSYTSLPESRTRNTSIAFTAELIEVSGGDSHSHGTEGDHSHGGVAFTTWLDLEQAAMQATAVGDALIELVPDQAAAMSANLAALQEDLAALHAEFRTVTSSIGDRPIVASHPVYRYLARAYGLSIEAVLWEPDRVPDADAMAELQDLLAEHAAVWMIWEGEPAEESIRMLDDVGVRSIVFDPCGNRPESGDWMSVMRDNLRRLSVIADSEATDEGASTD